MINIDKYLNITVDFTIKDEVIHVKQPTAKITKVIGNIEKDISEENYLDKKSEILLLLLNNNKENRVFTEAELEEYPYKIQDLMIKQIISLVVKADNDPN